MHNRRSNAAGVKTTIHNSAGPPPDDYRHLPIIPNVNEILSEQKTYLRENIVDGVYESPEHYLDVRDSIDRTIFLIEIFQVHFRLLREDFVGPLREGIQQYKSGASGKNFNVRVYNNVRLLGSRLSPRSGLVYDLRLDPALVSKITWVNSRRLIFGNLLVLTFDDFQSCAFVTVEDRTQIETSCIVAVKTCFVYSFSKLFFRLIR